MADPGGGETTALARLSGFAENPISGPHCPRFPLRTPKLGLILGRSGHPARPDRGGATSQCLCPPGPASQPQHQPHPPLLFGKNWPCQLLCLLCPLPSWSPGQTAQPVVSIFELGLDPGASPEALLGGGLVETHRLHWDKAPSWQHPGDTAACGETPCGRGSGLTSCQMSS